MATDSFNARRAEYLDAKVKALVQENGELKGRLQDSNHEIDRLCMVVRRQIHDESLVRKLSQKQFHSES
ncbi:MAG: hypothetical protein ABL885_12895 [Methylophilaceae bacterium]